MENGSTRKENSVWEEWETLRTELKDALSKRPGLSIPLVTYGGKNVESLKWYSNLSKKRMKDDRRKR